MDEMWISTTEAARLTGYSNRTVVNWILSGHVRGEKQGRDWRIDKGSLLYFARNHKTNAAPSEDGTWLEVRKIAPEIGYTIPWMLKLCQRGAIRAEKRKGTANQVSWFVELSSLEQYGVVIAGSTQLRLPGIDNEY